MPKPKRTEIPIPCSQFPTRIEVYHEGTLKLHGGVQPGDTKALIRLPATPSECDIRIIPCDQQGNPTGLGYVYKNGNVMPALPEVAAPKEPEPEVVPEPEPQPEPQPEPELELGPDLEMGEDLEVEEIKTDDEASVEITRVDDEDEPSRFDYGQ